MLITIFFTFLTFPNVYAWKYTGKLCQLFYWETNPSVRRILMTTFALIASYIFFTLLCEICDKFLNIYDSTFGRRDQPSVERWMYYLKHIVMFHSIIQPSACLFAMVFVTNELLIRDKIYIPSATTATLTTVESGEVSTGVPVVPVQRGVLVL